jgi:hypothetical protein
MQIRFDEEYIFCSKTSGRIYLYRVDYDIDTSIFGYINGGRKWKKLTLEEFNQMGLTLVGKYKR